MNTSAETAPQTTPAPETLLVEARGSRRRRHARRARLYASAFAVVGLLAIVVGLAAANARAVELHWLLGSSETSLVWIVLATAVLGWLLGIATSITVRLRTRRRVTPEPK